MTGSMQWESMHFLFVCLLVCYVCFACGLIDPRKAKETFDFMSLSSSVSVLKKRSLRRWDQVNDAFKKERVSGTIRFRAMRMCLKSGAFRSSFSVPPVILPRRRHSLLSFIYCQAKFLDSLINSALPMAKHGAPGELTLDGNGVCVQGFLPPDEVHVFGYARTKISDDELRNRIRGYLVSERSASPLEDASKFLQLEKKEKAENFDSLLFFFFSSSYLHSKVLSVLWRFGCYKEIYGCKLVWISDNEFDGMVGDKKKDIDTVMEKWIPECKNGIDTEVGIGTMEEKHRYILIGELFDEPQIYSIDHYLGKELVQNLLVLRFANRLFLPLWNRDNIDMRMFENHKVIVFREVFGTEGRGGYFDEYGVPFILKAGKALNSRKADICVQFKDVPGDIFKSKKQGRNGFVICLQPSEATYMKLTKLSFPYRKSLVVAGEAARTGDVNGAKIRCDQQHFVRRDELKAAWEIFTPLLHRIDNGEMKPIPYQPGSRGPAEADELLAKAGYVQTHGYIWIPPTL
ncbi:Glucose-6-phosphate 1-dehydrogenase [Hibiscus syriacus]|uniref:glucose-6-phosphate dehydrogenase (NADP(+)) n=1 Tax=Hibiscus syriacus TaxID=106335 RepID=A0A6A2ZRJ7_HIBSY|nr:Glucose-6-phosphate 1-dehydrogenase [Hibiscus syriacus]